MKGLADSTGHVTGVAIVTGTSRGIGAAVATALLARGWRVLGVARGAPPAALERQGYTHERLDLADLAAVESAFEGDVGERLELSVGARLGLVNNAGVLAPVGPVEGLERSALERSFLVNVACPLWLMGFALRRARGPLRIVNLSSGAATSAYPGWSTYCAGKAALRMAGAALGLELEERDPGRDACVVDYAPHVVATRMQEEIRATDEARFPRRERFVRLHAEGRLVAPEGPAAEIAELLGSDGLPAFSERRFQPAS